MRRGKGKNVSEKSVKRIFLPLDPEMQPRVTKMTLESDRLVVEAELPMKDDCAIINRIMSGLPVNMSMAGRATVKEPKVSWLRRAWRWVTRNIFRRKPKKEPLMVVDFQATHLELDLRNSYWNFDGEKHGAQESNQEVTEGA